MDLCRHTVYIISRKFFSKDEISVISQVVPVENWAWWEVWLLMIEDCQEKFFWMTKVYSFSEVQAQTRTKRRKRRTVKMQKKPEKRRKLRNQLPMIQNKSPAVSLQHQMMMIIIVTKTMLNNCSVIQTCPNMIAFVEYVVYFLVRNPFKIFHYIHLQEIHCWYVLQIQCALSVCE